MRFKEGVGSLSVYFILISILIGYTHFRPILAGDNLREEIFGILGILLALCFFFIGVKLKSFISGNVEFIFFIFVIAVIFFAIKSIFAILTGSDVLTFLQPIIGALVFWYLFTNIKRLAQEEQNKI